MEVSLVGEVTEERREKVRLGEKRESRVVMGVLGIRGFWVAVGFRVVRVRKNVGDATAAIDESWKLLLAEKLQRDSRDCIQG